MLQKTSYLTVSDAQIYFNGRLNTDDWDNSTIEQQTKALLQASTDIDKLAYLGQKVQPQQEHEFPRLFQNPSIDNQIYDSDNIPMGVKWAVCEQALALLGGFDVSKEIDSIGVVSSAYSTVKVDFADSIVKQCSRAGLCPAAWQFITEFIRDDGSIALARV